jgi:hypothetical protein
MGRIQKGNKFFETVLTPPIDVIPGEDPGPIPPVSEIARTLQQNSKASGYGSRLKGRDDTEE